jgi:HKD family nuclease
VSESQADAPVVELILLPYDGVDGKSLLSRLISELRSGNWSRFRAAVAFLSASGLYDEFLEALDYFASSGGVASLTFGADVFGAEGAGSELLAVEALVKRYPPESGVAVYLYHEKGRTFHPKVYLFDNMTTNKALLFLGSSNLSRGGLLNNVEAHVAIRLELSTGPHRDLFERLNGYLEDYWTEE